MNFETPEISSRRSEQNSQLSPFNSQQSVDLHIDELVLQGFSPNNRYAIGDAVERELAQLLAKQNVPISLQSGNTTDEIQGATFNAARNAKPSVIGRQIAQAVYQGFGK